MAVDPVSETQQRWRISQVCLGLFILWQVVFIVGNSLLQMIRDGREIQNENTRNLLSHLTLDLPMDKGPGYQVLKVFQRWAEVTGQEQGWSLFAPGIGDQARFLHVVLHWDDGRKPVVLPGPTEPADLKAFFRWGHSRLRKYESYLGTSFDLGEEENQEQANTRWQKKMQREVWRQSDYMPGYLLFRWRIYQKEHRDCPPPAQIQVHVVNWQIPPPGTDPWFWQKPITVPFARIRLKDDGSINGNVQAYNPVSKQFDDLQ
jgi:hypothetical protein